MIEISRPEVLSRQPLVSVLMLTYNHEPFLADAIEGVLSQQCEFPIELLIAEDCSTDATRAVAERYLAERPDVIRIITGETNIGMMPNLYRALSQCRGEFIAFCEGDDWWCDPQKLRKQIELLSQDDRIGMVHGNVVIASFVNGAWAPETIGRYDRRPRDELSGDLFHVLLKEHVTHTCTTVYRREVLDQLTKSILGNPNYLVGDVPLAIFCSAHWKIGYVEDVVAVYRLSPNSATRSGVASDTRLLDSLAQIYEDVEKLFGSRVDFDRRALMWIHPGMARTAFRAKNLDKFDLAIRRASAIDPSALWAPGILLRRIAAAIPFGIDIANALIDTVRRVQTVARRINRPSL